jgi:glutathione S-transferase
VPYLVDPNTGVALFESIEIRVYLDRTYTTSGYSPLVVGGGAAW